MGRNGNIHRISTFLRTSADAAALLAPGIMGLSHEQLCVAHLDGDGRVLGILTGADGDTASIDLPFREIVGQAIALGSSALVVAHNHPSGDPTPSPADKLATRRLADIVRGLDIQLLDHLVFGSRGCRSFRQMGLL